MQRQELDYRLVDSERTRAPSSIDGASSLALASLLVNVIILSAKICGFHYVHIKIIWAYSNCFVCLVIYCLSVLFYFLP
jgi:hypothetical protein